MPPESGPAAGLRRFTERKSRYLGLRPGMIFVGLRPAYNRAISLTQSGPGSPSAVLGPVHARSWAEIRPLFVCRETNNPINSPEFLTDQPARFLDALRARTGHKISPDPGPVRGFFTP